MKLNEAQVNAHWRLWNTVVAVNHWKDCQLRIADCGFLEEQKARSTWHREAISFAGTLARKRQSLDITAGDLRHGCAWAALGQPKSFTDFGNADLDRIFNLYRLLINPENLREVMIWNEYESGADPGERKRHLWAIGRVPAAYVNAILEAEYSFYQTSDVADLSLEKLRCLTRTLKNRRAKFLQPAENPF